MQPSITLSEKAIIRRCLRRRSDPLLGLLGPVARVPFIAIAMVFVTMVAVVTADDGGVGETSATTTTTPTTTPTPTPTAPPMGVMEAITAFYKNDLTLFVVILLTASLAVIGTCLGVIWCCLRRRRRQSTYQPQQNKLDKENNIYVGNTSDVNVNRSGNANGGGKALR